MHVSNISIFDNAYEKLVIIYKPVSMIKSRKVLLFLVDERIQMPREASHHRLTSETPLKWRFAGVPMMVQH